LLGYVACAQRWVMRDELVALFWPDRPEATARGNLRPMLAKLVQEPLAVGFERGRTRVRWSVRSDLEAFFEARRECRWADAWRLVDGELLDGVSVPGAPEFDSWLEIERSGVRDEVRTVGLQVADTALAAGALEDAGEVLSTLQRADPFDEVVVRRLLVALARRGARGEALAAFEAFVERCRDELGAEPEAATLELADAVRSGQEGSEVAYAKPPKTRDDRRARSLLPARLTPLVGRRRALREVVERLGDPGCRLLTLVGPGGIGKTRLALEVAHTVASTFADGAHVVDLTVARRREDVLAAIAASVGVRIDERGDAEAQVVRWLAARDTLLVLDNVEHLEGAPRLVQDLLLGASALRVVATSRVALGLAAEWRYDVPGLACREIAASDVDRDPWLPGDANGAGVLEPSDAAALFVAAGRRAAAVFDPDARQLDVIEGIVERVEGSPLAIELAAPWLRVMDVEAIDAELARGIDVLESDAPDRSPRHASVRGVLEESWSLLQPRERAVMRRAAAFRGGFTLDAAREVAEAELPTMLALVNKSFLRRGSDGRFSRHPLVWHVARERALAHGAELDAARERHAGHYLRMLADRRFARARPDGGRLLDEIEVDLENVKAAWRWVVAHDRHTMLHEALGGLLVFRSARGRNDLVEELLVEALANAPSEGALRVLLQAGIDYDDIWGGGGDYGEAGLREGVRLAEGRVDAFDWLWLTMGLGLALDRQGRHEEARPAYEAAAVAARELGDINSELTLQNNIAEGMHCLRDALRLSRALEARARASEATPVLRGVLITIAGHERLLGAFGRSERVLRAATPYVVDAEAVSSDTFATRNQLTLAYLEGGRLTRAEALACRTLRRRAFAHAREQFGDVVAGAAALLGRVALVRRDVSAAEAWSRRALDRHRSVHGSDAGFAYALETMARAALVSGDHEAAASWLDGVAKGPDPWWYHGRLHREARRIACRCCEAEVLVARREIAAAREVLREVLTWATRAELVAATLGALVSAARLFRAVAEAGRADSLLRYVRDHRCATFEARSSAAFELGGGTRELGTLDADGVRTESVDDTIAGVASVALEVAAALSARSSR
jgi:predicted ATPase/DNA-binding SARP family transcriptional activator